MKKFGKFFKSFTPVAEAVLLFSGHLGKGPFVALGNEDRIIPEPGSTPRFPSNATFCVPGKSFDGPVLKSEGHAADELSAPFFIRDTLEFNQELFIISYVISSRPAGIPG